MATFWKEASSAKSVFKHRTTDKVQTLNGVNKASWQNCVDNRIFLRKARNERRCGFLSVHSHVFTDEIQHCDPPLKIYPGNVQTRFRRSSQVNLGPSDKGMLLFLRTKPPFKNSRTESSKLAGRTEPSKTNYQTQSCRFWTLNLRVFSLRRSEDSSNL